MSHELNRFLNNVRVRLPGALDDVVKLELFNVLDEFCKETNAWQEVIPVAAVANQLEYELEPEEYRALIVRLLGVTADTFDVDSGDSPSFMSVGAWMPRPDLLVFRSFPSTDMRYSATVALTAIDPVNVGDALPEIPDWFLTLYAQDLLDGLLFKMMSQPAKPYTSPVGTMYHGRRFRNAIARARVAVMQSNTYNAQSWIFPSFAQCRK